MLEVLHLRYVGMAVDDCLAVLEAGRESRLPPRARTGVMDQPDPDVAGRDDALLRQGRLELRLVHVPVHALDRRTDPFQLLEKLCRDEVARVQDELGAGEPADAFGRQRPSAAWQVRVRDDGDTAQEAAATSPGSCRKRPAFQTSSPSA